MAAKTAVDASRTNAWNIEPERLVLVTDLSHPMFKTAISGAPPAPRMRSRKEIDEKLNDLPVSWTAAQALQWVKGEDV